MQISSIILRQQLALSGWRPGALLVMGLRDAEAGSGSGRVSAREGGWRGSQPFRPRPGRPGAGLEHPELELVWCPRDVPFFKMICRCQGASLLSSWPSVHPASQAALSPLHLLLLLSLLFPEQGEAEPQARVRGWARPTQGPAVARSGLLGQELLRAELTRS